MSLYSNSQNYYGQPSHGGPTYAAPASQSGYQYQYPQQQPHSQSIPPAPSHLFIDPAAFHRDYSTRLDSLQFNSRPAIQNLSFYAQEYARYADIVCQCLDSHIRKVPAWMKLPAFYLLDAISKNVYNPYASKFAPFIIQLFLDTYDSVDDNIKGKMEEMLLTWRNGAPSGKQLFGLGPQMAIERGIWGEQAGPGLITKNQVMSELSFARQEKERAIQQNPNDVVSKHHLQVLSQLQLLVEAGVSQEELSQILNQLHSVHSPSPASQAQWSQFTPPAPTPYPPPSTYTTNHGSSAPPKPEPIVLPALVTTEPLSADQTNLNISHILSSLVQSGLVSAPVPSAVATKAETVEGNLEEEPHPVTPTAEDLIAMKDARADYRERVLAHHMEASLVESSIDEPSTISDFLYDYLPLQCQQCGIRYSDTSLGKKRLEDHLDLHFRQNRKITQNSGRGHDRSWFTSVKDWVSEPSSDSSHKARTPKIKSAHMEVATAVEQAEKHLNLGSQFVTVPPGDEAKPLSCPVCKETLQVEFFEDEEEWVWRNAVKKDGTIYHATCHAEAISASNLVTRIKSELGTGSRASTPEVISSRSTPLVVRAPRSRSRSPAPSPSKFVGVKRKAEHEVSSLSDTGHIPPLKKLALAPS